MRLTTLLTWQEYKDLEERTSAREGYWRNDKRVFLPGMGWYNEWYLTLHRDHASTFLSPHYLRDWMGKRPPLCVVCPNGDEWCVDRRSSNGDGWRVEGEWPNITCAPSIVAGDYHGFLRGGEFTLDLDGKTWPIPNVTPDYGRPKQ